MLSRWLGVPLSRIEMDVSMVHSRLIQFNEVLFKRESAATAHVRVVIEYFRSGRE